MVEKYVCAVTPMGEVRLTLRSRKMAQLYLKLATLNRTPPVSVYMLLITGSLPFLPGVLKGVNPR